ncbi:MAG: hypothetical protein J6S13_04115 [Clostridia bacterium]|nr:hypothetical protein [Clostridia bacterium]
MFNNLKGVLRIISYILAAILGVGLILLLYSIVKWWILIVIPVGVASVLFPIMMKHGVKILNDERDSVYAQLAHNMPVQYNTRRIFRGFTELLLLMWLLPPVPFIVAGDLYVAILPIITVIIVVFEAFASNIWTDIGWSKGKYWLMNIGIYLVGIIIGVILNELIR